MASTSDIRKGLCIKYNNDIFKIIEPKCNNKDTIYNYIMWYYINATSAIEQKHRDSEQFVKLFTSHIALTFDLNAAGIKAFTVLMWAVQHTSLGKDIVMLNKVALDDFLEAHDQSIKLSVATFWRGLANLTKTKIIAKHVNQGCYFINPSLVFNGDRIAFTSLIERDRSTPKKVENEDQQDLFEST